MFHVKQEMILAVKIPEGTPPQGRFKVVLPATVADLLANGTSGGVRTGGCIINYETQPLPPAVRLGPDGIPFATSSATQESQ